MLRDEDGRPCPLDQVREPVRQHDHPTAASNQVPSNPCGVAERLSCEIGVAQAGHARSA
jgi:hypothetical protein